MRDATVRRTLGVMLRLIDTTLVLQQWFRQSTFPTVDTAFWCSATAFASRTVNPLLMRIFPLTAAAEHCSHGWRIRIPIPGGWDKHACVDLQDWRFDPPAQITRPCCTNHKSPAQITWICKQRTTSKRIRVHNQPNSGKLEANPILFIHHIKQPSPHATRTK